VQPVQPVRSWHRPKGQGLLPQPATQIGSDVVSYSVLGFFFVPGSQTQIGTRQQVPPQCMQAGDLPVSSLSAAAQASSATAMIAAVMTGLFMVQFSRL